jgi:hypothetical protein
VGRMINNFKLKLESGSRFILERKFEVIPVIRLILFLVTRAGPVYAPFVSILPILTESFKPLVVVIIIAKIGASFRTIAIIAIFTVCIILVIHNVHGVSL